MELSSQSTKYDYKFYFEDGISSNKITFYENIDYIGLLGTASVQLKDDATGHMLTKPFPAFAFDLDKQFIKGCPQAALDKWETFFRLSLSRVAKLNLNRNKIFIVPQIENWKSISHPLIVIARFRTFSWQPIRSFTYLFLLA